MVTFVIENKSAAVFYKSARHSFIRGHFEGVKVNVRKYKVFIHIERPYSVICNDLNWALRSHYLVASKKALDWLKQYTSL